MTRDKPYAYDFGGCLYRPDGLTAEQKSRALPLYAGSAPVATGEWVMVPREPTEAMLDAAIRSHGKLLNSEAYWVVGLVRDVWQAMRAAAPRSET